LIATEIDGCEICNCREASAMLSISTAVTKYLSCFKVK